MKKSGKPAEQAKARAGSKRPSALQRRDGMRRRLKASVCRRQQARPKSSTGSAFSLLLATSPPTAPRRDAERPTFLSDAKAAFERAADADGLDTQQRMAALRELLQVYEARTAATLPLPSKAPQLWVDQLCLEREPGRLYPAAFMDRGSAPASHAPSSERSMTPSTTHFRCGSTGTQRTPSETSRPSPRSSTARSPAWRTSSRPTSCASSGRRCRHGYAGPEN